jgi:hypothetical protein
MVNDGGRGHAEVALNRWRSDHVVIGSQEIAD